MTKQKIFLLSQGHRFAGAQGSPWAIFGSSLRDGRRDGIVAFPPLLRKDGAPTMGRIDNT